MRMKMLQCIGIMLACAHFPLGIQAMDSACRDADFGVHSGTSSSRVAVPVSGASKKDIWRELLEKAPRWISDFDVAPFTDQGDLFAYLLYKLCDVACVQGVLLNIVHHLGLDASHDRGQPLTTLMTWLLTLQGPAGVHDITLEDLQALNAALHV